MLSGKGRTFRVWLDTNQYQRDMAKVIQGEEVSNRPHWLTYDVHVHVNVHYVSI